jgi:hypothetical protein
MELDDAIVETERRLKCWLFVWSLESGLPLVGNTPVAFSVEDREFVNGADPSLEFATDAELSIFARLVRWWRRREYGEPVSEPVQVRSCPSPHEYLAQHGLGTDTSESKEP